MLKRTMPIFTILASGLLLILNAPTNADAFGIVLSDGEEEIMCPNMSFSGVVDISYSYSIETAVLSDLDTIIADMEHALTIELSKLLLPCGLNNNSTFDYFDPDDLNIVGISSLPRDERSEMGYCTSLDYDCNIVNGSLTLFLKSTADLSLVRYATRYAISQIMQRDILVYPRVDDLYLSSYRGPQFQKPEVATGNQNSANTILVDGSKISRGSGLTQIQIVTLATLVSAVIGILAAAVMFKKVFVTKTNVFSACDGTGIDKDYIESAHTPGVRAEDVNYSITASRDLSGIDNMSQDHSSLSDASIYSMSVSGISHTRSIMGWDDNSVATEKTRRIANVSRNSTPKYGAGLSSHDESDDEDDYVVQDLHII